VRPAQDILSQDLGSRVFRALSAREHLPTWLVSLAAMGVNFSFLFLFAFREDPAGLTPSGILTWGIPFGIGVLGVFCLLTGLYVHWASRTHDAMISELRRKWGR
jgi:uncharacterized membrane protein (DUF485 family)